MDLQGEDLSTFNGLIGFYTTASYADISQVEAAASPSSSTETSLKGNIARQ